MATDFHAEHVGSLLRQPWLLHARAEHKQGKLSEAGLREVEDRAAAENIETQRAAGIEVFTDGEVRRTNWMTGILESTGGMTEVETPGVMWHREDGEIPPTDETDFVMTTAVAKVYRKNKLTNVEAEYMAARVPGQFKVTMMSAAMGAMVWRPDLSAAAYPSPADLVGDLIALQVEEIGDLIERGARWVQLDSLSYNLVFDDEFRAATGNAEVDPRLILEGSVAADAAIVNAVKDKHPDVTIGMHICRGNNRSAYMAKGGYEPVAERLFGEVGVDRFLLEYDTERAGGFEPLRFIRPGTTVVLGLISSKVPALESQDDLRRRIDEAARYVPMENLAISPQCGFASTSLGNVLTPDEQKRKLELVVNTAQKVWGYTGSLG
jgi:5-methyltetrahydropteroyltriglutamate--homocysteine methyltransferase